MTFTVFFFAKKFCIMVMVIVMNIELHLENFDGPLDLLLHLVKETKVDIYEINMSEIIESYLSYIHSLQELNIDVGSDFLVMAANLLHLKSKKLLGKEEEDEDQESEYAITSEEDLKQRILEYEKYKNITRDLQDLEAKRKEVFTKVPENLKEYQEERALVNEGLTIEDLLKALLEVEKRLHYKEPIETKITQKELSVKEQILHIKNILKSRKSCRFDELFIYKTKEYIITTFLAILEMSKQKEIRLEQKNSFEPIMVEAI